MKKVNITQIKVALIMQAYGKHYSNLSANIDHNSGEYNGTSVSGEIRNDLDIIGNQNKFIPKKLIGLANNGGWTIIQDEGDLPALGTDCMVAYSKESIQHMTYNDLTAGLFKTMVVAYYPIKIDPPMFLFDIPEEPKQETDADKPIVSGVPVTLDEVLDELEKMEQEGTMPKDESDVD